MADINLEKDGPTVCSGTLVILFVDTLASEDFRDNVQQGLQIIEKPMVLPNMWHRKKVLHIMKRSVENKTLC